MNQGQPLTLKLDNVQLSQVQLEQYRRDGHLVVPQVLLPTEVIAARPALMATANREREKLSNYERSVGASGSQFIYDLREIDPVVWQFIASPRLAQVAAELLETDRIRILHYNCFFKPAGGRGTAWHQDYLYIPLEAEKLITAWVPLVNLTAEMGLLTLASGSHRCKTADLATANQYSQGDLEQMLSEQGLQLTTVGNLAVGDVSFHSSLTLHGAPPNRSHQMRAVVAVSYYADEARIQDPEDYQLNSPGTLQSIAYRQHFLREYFPHLKPGDLAHTSDHPIVYQRMN
ncbi:MAG: phytanoyl-CoA dioxygenase family protein [Moorea sp. SIO4E2]|uniref:phytanoyl-CoA dioxygenase family protein n=1 Tax=Moorena sp. SIO4E2 TaxID=2607826 RepID=UPI0013BB41DF|nr:phytanoyl-CoA dioxygenase family protein [Moorena sp. SIO4E2]NEQ07042.1 phytanoyl-CoA dioxygenase family protein [Moorena sp. SIO4E2]